MNRPLTDADGGIVLDRRNSRYEKLGPDGDNEGPDIIIDELCDLVGPKVRETYPKAKVKRSRRGLLVEFNEPLNDEEDPTVDLIVTLTRKDADGLWIPDRDNNKWTPSHPEKHTELFTGGTKSLRALRARVARLGKAWNKQFDEDDRALSSFNIVTLAWEYIDDSSVPLDQALAGWFRFSHDEIDKGETKDPAGVSDPIRLLLPKSLVLKRLGGAADRLEDALANEDDEDKVKDALSSVYPDYVDAPAGSKSAMAAALRSNEGVGASKAGLVIGGGAAIKKNADLRGQRRRVGGRPLLSLGRPGRGMGGIGTVSSSTARRAAFQGSGSKEQAAGASTVSGSMCRTTNLAMSRFALRTGHARPTCSSTGPKPSGQREGRPRARP